MINRKFWNNKKVFITGHTGFKGSWLSIWLKILGARVYGYSINVPTEPSLFKLANIEKLIDRNYFKDIKNFNSLNNAINSVNPSIIFHLAAQPSVRYSYQNPIQTIKTNVLGCSNLLEIIKNNKTVKSVVMVATDKVYLNEEKKRSFKEEDPLGGKDVYSASKACSELILKAYSNSFFQKKKFNIGSARSGNVIGGGDWTKDRIVPDCLKSFSNNGKLTIRYPASVRPWQHVLEPLYGYILLAQKLYGNKGNKFTGAWNFGPKKENNKKVYDLSKKIKKIMKSKSKIKILPEKKMHESKYLFLNSSKSNKHLRWKKFLNLDQTIKLTVEWYHDFRKKKNLRITTISQINYFMKMINGKKI